MGNVYDIIESIKLQARCLLSNRSFIASIHAYTHTFRLGYTFFQHLICKLRIMYKMVTERMFYVDIVRCGKLKAIHSAVWAMTARMLWADWG